MHTSNDPIGVAQGVHPGRVVWIHDPNATDWAGYSSPEEFIKSAERYGFMTLVDRWVVREAFSWISQLMDVQKVVPNLSINLSSRQVHLATCRCVLDRVMQKIANHLPNLISISIDKR